MAGKEERIKVNYYVYDPCKGCTSICEEDICCETRDNYREGITRQAAINKIRIAMHKVFIKQEPAGPLFLNYAEAALNALLGVEK